VRQSTDLFTYFVTVSPALQLKRAMVKRSPSAVLWRRGRAQGGNSAHELDRLMGATRVNNSGKSHFWELRGADLRICRLLGFWPCTESETPWTGRSETERTRDTGCRRLRQIPGGDSRPHQTGGPSQPPAQPAPQASSAQNPPPCAAA